MTILLFLCAAFEFIFGVMVVIQPKGAFHELLAAVLIGFSVMTFGLGAILDQLVQSAKEKRIGPM